jgi:hypothetical protein
MPMQKLQFRETFATILLLTIAQPGMAASLKFSAEIPPLPTKMQVLTLTSQEAPIGLIESILAKSGYRDKLAPLHQHPFFQKNEIKTPDHIVGLVEDEHLKVWVDRETGDIKMFPSLGKVKALTADSAEQHRAVVEELFRSPDFIAKDDTRLAIDEPDTLLGARLVRDARGEIHFESPKAPYLNFFVARRFVGAYPVDGPGSRALAQVDGNGDVVGLLRSWKKARIDKEIETNLTVDMIKSEIGRQLKQPLSNSEVTVDRIDLAYYDSNGRYLQPVVRFTARIHALTMPKTPARTADNFVVGYIPFSKDIEPLPALGTIDGPSPQTPEKNVPHSGKDQEGKPNDPIVGRYVVRNDDSGWVNDANAFWGSLAASPTAPLFSNSQYYWAEPRLFTNEKDFFINAMNLALVEVHGDWWLFSTLQNCCDLVNIQTDIPNPGYGPSGNGRLADWIIHSCEVVPSPDDTATWPSPWWNIFSGVRNVVGYRTIMYISDGAGGPYGASLGNVAPVVSSWLSDVMSLNAYSGHPKAVAHGGINRPMGRPATISACGHDNDSAFSTSSLSPANCLTVWWIPD